MVCKVMAHTLIPYLQDGVLTLVVLTSVEFCAGTSPSTCTAGLRMRHAAERLLGKAADARVGTVGVASIAFASDTLEISTRTAGGSDNEALAWVLVMMPSPFRVAFSSLMRLRNVGHLLMKMSTPKRPCGQSHTLM